LEIREYHEEGGLRMTKEEAREVREFEGIEVTYPPEDICIYPEYKGKPYFGIRYRENGESIVGYGTYNPQVLSRYLKDYFMSTTKNDIRDNRVKNELNRVKDELEPTTKNDLEVDWESYKDVDGNSLDDLILEVLQNNFDCGNTYGYKVADEIIGLLPSVTPQEPRWIPVTERLPENAKHKGAFCPKYYVMTEYGVTEGWYNPDVKCWYALLWFMDGQFEEWNINIDKGDIPKLVKNVPVIAWMPLPEPYKAESEGQDAISN
jgi:hypothetical protein